jgi:hypothetical protein
MCNNCWQGGLFRRLQAITIFSPVTSYPSDFFRQPKQNKEGEGHYTDIDL